MAEAFGRKSLSRSVLSSIRPSDGEAAAVRGCDSIRGSQMTQDELFASLPPPSRFPKEVEVRSRVSGFSGEWWLFVVPETETWYRVGSTIRRFANKK